MQWCLAIGVALALCIALSSGLKNEASKAAPVKENVGSATTEGRPKVEIKLKTDSIAGKTKDASKSASKPSAVVEDIRETKNTDSTGNGGILTSSEINAAVESLTIKNSLGGLKKARILVMLPMPFYSHTKNYMPIFKELARRGHNITMVSPYPQEEPLPNWEDIVTENVIKQLMGNLNAEDLLKMGNSMLAKIMGINFFADNTIKFFSSMPPVKDLWNDDSREYDLVFVETQFVQEPLLAFGWKYKAPVISLFPSFIIPEVAYYTGNPVLTTNYVPIMYFEASNNMDLYQRLETTTYAVLKLMMYNLYYLPRMDSYMRHYFPSPDMPYIADMLFNVSFTLMDSNPVLVYPYPRANNIREFLGINTKPSKPLSPEIQEFMDGADQDGVLLFTLGSTFPASLLRPQVIDSLMYAFSKIPQKVIMKWDGEEPPANLPPNVLIMKWLPQPGILGHKNCRAFFTHNGVHGLMEAMDHGVPTISLPLFADQKFFATWAETRGVGKKIDHYTITPEIALATISEVINNPKYKQNAVDVSIMMKDVPQPTIDEVIYWVEHVLRTKGARHLRPGSLNLWWYQRFGLDVLAVALVLILVPIWVFFKIIRCLCSFCRRKSKNAETEKNRMKSKKEN